MSILTYIAVLLASFFQAWWNFRLKSVPVDKSAFLFVSWLFFGVLLTPLSVFVLDKPFEWSWLPYILGTGLAQGLYLVLLCWAYTVADISLVFPLARGLAVGLTTAVLGMMGIHSLSKVGMLGIVAVMLGAFCLASLEIRSVKNRVGIFLALALALVITSYTVIDSLGAKEIPILFYVLIMNVIGPVCAFPFLWKGRKNAIILVWKKWKWRAFIVALAGSGGYLVVLWAYQNAPAPYVLALREISIVFATLLGVHYLGEKIYPRKFFGIALILAGIFLIKLA